MKANQKARSKFHFLDVSLSDLISKKELKKVRQSIKERKRLEQNAINKTKYTPNKTKRSEDLKSKKPFKSQQIQRGFSIAKGWK